MRKMLLTICLYVLAAFILQLFLLIRDRKKNKTIPSKFSVLKLTPFLLAILGVCMYAFSWVELPMTGGLSFFQILRGGSVHTGSLFDEDLLFYAILIFFSLGLMVSATILQLALRITIKSVPTLVYEVLIGLASTTLGLFAIDHVKHILDNEFSGILPGFNGLFQQIIQVSTGTGLIVLTSIGVIYAAFVLILQRRNSVLLKKAATPYGEYANLRELKKLLDEGVITQEEFDRKKSETLA
jgi:hypothetical protein